MASSAATISAAAPSQAEWRPSYNPWLVALTVTLATFMEVLDTSIANVALPHIAGGLGASFNESTWVLTSYLVSNGIVLPISAWLATRYGRKRFYMTCVAIFATSSFLCGLAPSLGVLVFFRVIQGIGGGGLQPSEQAILADTFPASKRGMAFAVYGMAVVTAPAIGPTFGGWLTDNYSWRWIFYINVPISIISLLLSSRIVEDPPYLKEEQEKSRRSGVDYIGLGLLALGIGGLQIVLDKGQEKDWFATHWITVVFTLALIILVAWVIWEWRHKRPIVELQLLKNRNFATAVFFMFVLGMVLYGTTVLIPQFLQYQLGYSAVNAGEALAGGGLIMLVMMPLAGRLVSKVDPRGLMTVGFMSTAVALFFMAQHLTLGMDFGTAFMLRIYQTMALPLIFIPSNVLSYVGIPREKNNQISSMINFVRNIGGSIGIATITTYITRNSQTRQAYLARHMTPANPTFNQMLHGIAAALQAHGLSASRALQQAYSRLSLLLQQQATTLAYVDALLLMAVVILCLSPLTFIMRKPTMGGQAPPPAH